MSTPKPRTFTKARPYNHANPADRERLGDASGTVAAARIRGDVVAQAAAQTIVDAAIESVR